jgi:hypothetical protein
MNIKISYREVKVRRRNSQNLEGADKFTGAVTYQTFGSLDGKPFRLSLGAEERSAAKRRTAKIERAVLEGVTSPLWAELVDSLPPTTFKFRNGCAVYQPRHPQPPRDSIMRTSRYQGFGTLLPRHVRLRHADAWNWCL